LGVYVELASGGGGGGRGRTDDGHWPRLWAGGGFSFSPLARRFQVQAPLHHGSDRTGTREVDECTAHIALSAQLGPWHWHSLQQAGRCQWFAGRASGRCGAAGGRGWPLLSESHVPLRLPSACGSTGRQPRQTPVAPAPPDIHGWCCMWQVRRRLLLNGSSIRRSLRLYLVGFTQAASVNIRLPNPADSRCSALRERLVVVGYRTTLRHCASNAVP
jgi:hypothetical protein